MVNTELNTELHETVSGVSALVPEGASQKDTGEKDSGLLSRTYRILFEGLRTYPRLRMFLSECRSFLYRSRIVLTSKDTHRVPIGPAYLESPSGLVFRNIRSLACNEDIERNASNRPWAAPLDWAAYRDSWEAGVEWAVNTLGSNTLVDSEHKALLISKRLQLKV
jgi:hypothetical protein